MDGLQIFFIFYILGGLYGAFKTGQWVITAGAQSQSIEWGIANGIGLAVCILCGAIVWPMVVSGDCMYQYLQIEEKIK